MIKERDYHYEIKASKLKAKFDLVKQARNHAIDHQCQVLLADFKRLIDYDGVVDMLDDIGVCTKWYCSDGNVYVFFNHPNIRELKMVLETFNDDEVVWLQPTIDGRDKSFKANTGSKKTYLDVRMQNGIFDV